MESDARAISWRYFLALSRIYQRPCLIDGLAEIRIPYGGIDNQIHGTAEQFLQ
jgi:hypothetical protein